MSGILSITAFEGYGIEVEHGIEDRVIIYLLVNGKKKRVGTRKIYYNNKGSYFNYNNSRFYLEEFMAV